MTRNVRNFWIDLSVDGRASSVETGPRSKDGGFSMTIYQRDEGDIVTAAKISGLARSDGSLISLTIRVNDGKGSLPTVAIFDTER